MFNWLLTHNAFLASDKYNWKDQIELIKTFLHTGAQLQKRTKNFSYGNHHTKGLSSLFQLAVLFPEFSGTEVWLKQSIDLLTLHLQREINDDGFQFERSVHYHIGDIENYFYVYQLAKINNIKLPAEFTKKLRSMFEALVKIAQPDKHLPVLQDDTDAPWSEFNRVDIVMTIGAILFQNKTFRYFSSDEIPSDYYWLIKPDDAKIIYKEKGEKPFVGSTALSSTGYYVMRNGWETNNDYMVISAGLSKEKPDHQHGDMLGLVSYSNENEILPNYQVRYFLDDLNTFKSSWVKNVALVDSVPQGQNWKPNSGGSGFGKWEKLPQPKTLQWFSSDDVDYFAGTHNGYDSINVKYFREVIFIKDGFWIVKDNFKSSSNHSFQQIWQGHYGIENNNHLRSTFANGSGLEIIQLKNDNYKINCEGWHGKQNFVFNVSNKKDFSFSTLLFPFKKFGEIINNAQNDSFNLGDWKVLKNIKTSEIESEYLFNKNDSVFLLINAKYLTLNNQKFLIEKPSTLYIKKIKEKFEIILLGNENIKLSKTKDKFSFTKELILIPGEKIKLEMAR